jgi:hypothetical protein
MLTLLIVKRINNDQKTYPLAITEQLKLVDTITDNLNKSVDNGIRLLVAALRAHGFATDSSCQGHLESRNGGPFVWVSSEKAVPLVSKLWTIPPASDEAETIRRDTARFNLDARSSLLNLLDEFYQGSLTASRQRLIITGIGAIETNIIQRQDTAIANRLYNEQDYKAWLTETQGEFDSFASFLIAGLDSPTDVAS